MKGRVYRPRRTFKKGAEIGTPGSVRATKVGAAVRREGSRFTLQRRNRSELKP